MALMLLWTLTPAACNLADRGACDRTAGQVPRQLCRLQAPAFTELCDDRATGAAALTAVDLIKVLYECLACVAWLAGKWQMPMATAETQSANAAAASAQLLNTLAM